MFKFYFGFIGFGVMGENFVLNVECNGFFSVVYNCIYVKIEDFFQGCGKDKNIQGVMDFEDFVGKLECFCRILMMVKVGFVVDVVVDQFFFYFEEGDLLIDGGNFDYYDIECWVK